jgi:hypothetical protein
VDFTNPETYSASRTFAVHGSNAVLRRERSIPCENDVVSAPLFAGIRKALNQPVDRGAAAPISARFG